MDRLYNQDSTTIYTQLPYYKTAYQSLLTLASVIQQSFATGLRVSLIHDYDDGGGGGSGGSADDSQVTLAIINHYKHRYRITLFIHSFLLTYISSPDCNYQFYFVCYNLQKWLCTKHHITSQIPCHIYPSKLEETFLHFIGTIFLYNAVMLVFKYNLL